MYDIGRARVRWYPGFLFAERRRLSRLDDAHACECYNGRNVVVLPDRCQAWNMAVGTIEREDFIILRCRFQYRLFKCGAWSCHCGTLTVILPSCDSLSIETVPPRGIPTDCVSLERTRPA